MDGSGQEARKLLTLTEAAARLRIHPNTLRKWTDAGRVPAVRRPGGGGYRRYDPTVINAVQREMGIPDEDGTQAREGERP